MANMMGFKKIDRLPERKRRGVYDDVLETVAKTADMYALDTHDIKRCKSLVATLRARIKNLDLPVKVIIRDTTVCVVHKSPIVKDMIDGMQDAKA